MKATAEKSAVTASRTAARPASQPFFAKAGGGNFFAPASRTAAPSVQMKMTVGKTGDTFEREADKMADKVMRMPTPAPQTAKEEKIQRKVDERLQKAAKPEEKIQNKAKQEEKIQKAPVGEDKLRRKGEGVPAVTPNLQAAIRSKTSGGQPLSSDVRSFMEPRFSADFSNVRVHNDAESAGLSNQLSARAFTYQNHIFFSRDQYHPGTSAGKQLLAHELTHTIQQTGGTQFNANNLNKKQKGKQNSPQLSFTSTTARSNDHLYLQRSILSSLKGAAGAGWNAVAGIAEKGWSWISDRVIEPLKSLASQGWNSIKNFGSQIAKAYRQADPNIRDIFNPMHPIFRTVRNLRRNLFAKAIQEEKQRRVQDATKNPDPNAPINEPSQLEKLNGLMETLDSSADQVFEINKEIVEGAILGDFKENPTIWNTIGQIAMGFVPYAGQVADVRDMVAAIDKLRKSGWKDGGAWFSLILTGIGFIPGFGDAVKAIGRGAKGFLGKALKGVLKNADTILRPVLKRAKGMLSAAWRYGRRFVDWAKKLGPKLLRGVQDVAGRAVSFAKSIGQRAFLMVGALRSRVGKLIQGAAESAKGLISRARGFLGQAVGRFLGRVRQVFDDVQRRVSGAAESVGKLAQQGKEIAIQVGRRIADAVQGATKLLQESVQSAMKRGREALEAAKRWGVQQFNKAKELGGRLVTDARRRVKNLIDKGVKWVKEKAIKWVKDKIRNIKDRILNFLRKLWYKVTKTKPSGKPDPNATPIGKRTKIGLKDDAETVRSLQRENDSADLLARNGYRIEQNPKIPGSKNPDYKIEGRIFDNYAPSKNNPRNIWKNIKESKIDTGQAERIVLNLDDSGVDLKALKKQFNDWPIPKLKEIIVVKNGQVIPFWP